MSLDSLSKNRGRACLGLTCAAACSLVMKCRYSLTELSHAGFPLPKRSFQGPFLPVLEKIALSLPIILSTVPAARRVGHLQGVLEWDPKSGHWGIWTLVFPFPSFQTRKRVRSWGVAD